MATKDRTLVAIVLPLNVSINKEPFFFSQVVTLENLKNHPLWPINRVLVSRAIRIFFLLVKDILGTKP